jgi:ABC-type amino acid transport substrate-binding protein
MPLMFAGPQVIDSVYAQTNGIAQSTLVMGTEADYIPFEFRYASEPASDIVGFDIAVANAIADQLGFTIAVEERPFAKLIPGLQAGELDFAIAAITPTPERLQFVDFSEVYFESRQALISRRSNPVRTVTDLPGSTVAVQRGTIQEQAALQLLNDGVDIRIQTFEHMNDIVSAVREQSVDVAFIEELVAEAYLENNPTLELDVLGEVPPIPLAIAFPKGSAYVEPFNQVLRDLKDSGELEELTRLWFTSQP